MENFLKNIIDNPAEYYREVCAKADHIEDGYHFPDFYRVGNTQGGLILLQDGLHGSRLPADWEEIKGRAHLSHCTMRSIFCTSTGIRDQENPSFRQNRCIGKRSIDSYRFIQNFFDNPVIRLQRVDDPPSTFRLLGPYLDSKYNAQQQLGREGFYLTH